MNCGQQKKTRKLNNACLFLTSHISLSPDTCVNPCM